MSERYVLLIRRLADQQVAVEREVPMPRTSRGKSSPCCQGTLPRPVAKDATKIIIESRTLADQPLEYEVPSMRMFPVLRVMTARRRKIWSQNFQAWYWKGHYVQCNVMLARTNPMIIPGAESNIILLLPIESIHFSAINVNKKFVPEMMSPTAVGWLKPISANKVAE